MGGVRIMKHYYDSNDKVIAIEKDNTEAVFDDAIDFIQSEDKTFLKKFRDGYEITRNGNDLSVGNDPINETPIQKVTRELGEATTAKAQHDKLNELLILERGLTPKT